MVSLSSDIAYVAFFLGVHALIVWVVVLTGLWLNRLGEALAARRRQPDLRG